MQVTYLLACMNASTCDNDGARGMTELSGCSRTQTLPSQNDKSISKAVISMRQLPRRTNGLDSSPRKLLETSLQLWHLHRMTNDEHSAPHHVNAALPVAVKASSQRRKPWLVRQSWQSSLAMSKAAQPGPGAEARSSGCQACSPTVVVHSIVLQPQGHLLSCMMYSSMMSQALPWSVRQAISNTVCRSSQNVAQ